MLLGTGRIRPWSLVLALAFCVLLFCVGAEASIGDNLPEFEECVEVSYIRIATTPALSPCGKSAMVLWNSCELD